MGIWGCFFFLFFFDESKTDSSGDFAFFCCGDSDSVSFSSLLAGFLSLLDSLLAIVASAWSGVDFSRDAALLERVEEDAGSGVDLLLLVCLELSEVLSCVAKAGEESVLRR